MAWTNRPFPYPDLVRLVDNKKIYAGADASGFVQLDLAATGHSKHDRYIIKMADADDLETLERKGLIERC